MNIVTNFFNEELSSSGKTRYIANTNNLKVNSILFDCKFTVPESYTGKWDFLKSIFVTIALRLGSGNGSAVNLISSCSLYQLLAYSDYIAGVSMHSTTFTAGTVARVSGSIPIGFFSMGARDSLDAIVNLADPSALSALGGALSLSIGSVYEADSLSILTTYQSAKPTGAMQNYTNVLRLFYDGDSVINKEVNVIDQLGSQNVNIEDAIALSNATGRFEFFTRFGCLYSDPFDLSQDLSFKCPTDDTGAEILIVGYHFDPALLVSNSNESAAQRNNLVAQIKENDADKYSYLLARGLVS